MTKTIKIRMPVVVSHPDIHSAKLHVNVDVMFHAYALPFAPVYCVFSYLYTSNFFGGDDVAQLMLTVVVAVHVLLALACHWSVNARALLTCRRVLYIRESN